MEVKGQELVGLEQVQVLVDNPVLDQQVPGE